MKRQKCTKCNKGYNVLTSEGLCYYCHLNKYKVPPTDGAYKKGKDAK